MVTAPFSSQDNRGLGVVENHAELSFSLVSSLLVLLPPRHILPHHRPDPAGTHVSLNAHSARRYPRFSSMGSDQYGSV